MDKNNSFEDQLIYHVGHTRAREILGLPPLTTEEVKERMERGARFSGDSSIWDGIKRSWLGVADEARGAKGDEGL
jgi:hypothetical protein